MVGTLSYMAPELCRGQLYGKKSDIWSLGCVFYTVLTLKIAFDAPTLAGVLNKILYGTIKDPIDVQMYDKSFADMVEKMLNREPELRPDTSMLMCNHLIATFILQFVVDFGIAFGS